MSNACTSRRAALGSPRNCRTRVLVTVAASLLSSTALAGQINGVVLEVGQSEIPLGTPNMVVIASGTVAAQPACHIAGPHRMLIDQRTDHGRAMANLAVVARVTGMPVTILGTGLCSVNSQIETAALFIL